MPPVLILVAGAAGALFGFKALKREWRRINADLDAADRRGDRVDGAARPTLKRDPASGEWRPR